MLSPVSTSDPRQDAQSLLVKQKQAQKPRDDSRNVQNNQRPSTLSAQRADNAAPNRVRPETQNSPQLKGAFLNVRA